MGRFKEILKIAFWAILIIVIIAFYFSGNDNSYSQYSSKIVFDDIGLRTEASNLAKDCPSGNKECQLNSVYSAVVKQYNYYSDPRTKELIQTPYETMKVKGGDCEDLTILLNSLLENIGIKTYLVLTEDHAYSLACGIDIEKLQYEIMNSFNKEISFYDESFSLNPLYAKYLSGTQSSVPLELEWSLDSNEPITINFVDNETALNFWAEGKSYNYYPSCSKSDILRASGNCLVGGVMEFF